MKPSLGCDGIFPFRRLYWQYSLYRGGAELVIYLDVVALLNFVVDYLLLLGTNRLCGYPPGWGRSAWAAALGGIYGAACMLPRFRFLGNSLWRIVILALMGWIAFGSNKCTVRRTVIFVLLCMALGGIAQGMGRGGVGALVASATALSAMCLLGFRDRPGSVRYVPVELPCGDTRLRLTALCDTGNTLYDPVTGRPVLVVGAEVAQQLSGLTLQQLRSPVDSMEQSKIPGLRLVPYRTIGQNSGMLLAMRFSGVRIGNWHGSSLVAFAPEKLCNDGRYQALTGGAA